MEVVGVVAAVPGLIEIIHGVATAVQGFANRKSSAKAATRLISQLHDIEDLLEDVHKSWKSNPSSRTQLQKLAPTFKQLSEELRSLEQTLNSPTSSKRPGNFFKRAYLLSTGPDKAIKESLVSLTQLKTSLTLIIARHNDGVADGSLTYIPLFSFT